jgi:hypothetical protein
MRKLEDAVELVVEPRTFWYRETEEEKLETVAVRLASGVPEAVLRCW